MSLPRQASPQQDADAERWFGVYAVVSGDAAIVTTAHRTHRRFH